MSLVDRSDLDRKKVLVVSEVYWPEGGGSEVATHSVLQYLKRYLDITVITGTTNAEMPAGVKYIYEPLLRRKEKPLLWFNILQLTQTSRFQKLVNKTDIVYIPRLGFPVIPYAKKKGKRVIVHLHDYTVISYSSKVLAPYESHKRRIINDNLMLECTRGIKYCGGAIALWWLPALAKSWVSLADKIVCVSKRQAEIIAEMAPELKDKIEVIYNPLPPNLASETHRKDIDDTPTLLYMGGDNYAKGFHLILYAIRYLIMKNIKVKFILTNNYSSQSLYHIKVLARKSKTVEIDVVGRLNYKELSNIRRRAWALLFPSIWEEPLPYAIIEAGLAATVPIAARVGGVPEILGGTPAEKYMFTPGSVGEFIKMILTFISNSRDKVRNMGVELRQNILTLFGEKNIDKFVKMFIGDE